MKKSLVLAMAMALGVTASAYAANPFSDVPAGHWAYDSISKLAAAGVIEGYGDATFGGDKLMTRYEMAQIVAKAMAKGANVDKLAAEFADELDNLGVRVANLEKKADNVKITGNVRARYVSQEDETNGSDHDGTLRSRLWFNGQVNEDWSYTAMLQNNQNFTNDKENKGEEGVDFQRAYVEGKIGGVNVTAGRYNFFIADGNIYDTRADGIEVSYGKDIKVTGFVGRATDGIVVVPETRYFDNDELHATTGGNYAGLTVSGNIAKNLKLEAGYINFKDMGREATYYGDAKKPISELPKIDNAIWHVGATYELGDVAVSAMYLKGDLSADGVPGAAIDEVLDDDGYVLGVSYKGAKSDVVGSWGLGVKYYDQGAQTYVAHTTDANTFGMTGFKGYGITADYTLAKNIVASVAYYDTESKLADKAGLDLDDQRIFTEVNFYF